jgi:hypothetical protein
VATTRIKCAFCKLAFDCKNSRLNRAAEIGAPLYCGKACAGLGRRSFKSQEQKRADKAAYDAIRRVELAGRIKAEKAAHHKATYDPVKAAIERKARMHKHVAYCRRPEYRVKKSQYDRGGEPNKISANLPMPPCFCRTSRKRLTAGLPGTKSTFKTEPSTKRKRAGDHCE